MSNPHPDTDDGADHDHADEFVWLSVERTTSTGHRLLHYDGPCANLHGHNMRWEVDVRIDLSATDESNMAVDLKDIAAVLDTYDHALVLNSDDPLVDALTAAGHDPDAIHTTAGDPTCERVASTVAQTLIADLPVDRASVDLYETDKYGITASAADQ